MINTPKISIGKFRKLCFIVLTIFFTSNLFSQTTFNWPDFLNNNSGGPIFYSESLTLGGCTSITFSMDYNSNDWQPNGGVLEDAAFCAGCSGDPADALTPECDFCWDFLDFDLIFDGNIELDVLIGTTLLITDETFTFESDCLDPTQSYDIELEAVSATWQNLENIDLTNITIICYDEVLESDIFLIPGDELCEGDDITLNLNNAWDQAEWSFGGSNVASGFTTTLTGLTPADSGTYTVEATDINGCTSSVDFDIDILPIPTVCPVNTPIEPCSNLPSGAAELDLTIYDSEANCFGSDDVLWFEDLADIPDFPIIDPTTYEAFTGSLYAVTYNGTCYSDSEEVFIDVTSGIDPEIDIGDVMICEGENLNFDVINIPSCGSCDFDWEGPPGSGVNESTTTSQYSVLNANPSLTGTWTVTVTDDNGCTGASDVAVTVVPGPSGTISGGGSLCPGFCTDASNDLTLNLSGGTPPYDVTLAVEVAGLPLGNITLPAFLPNGSISLCIDPSFGLAPSLEDFDGDGMQDLVIPTLLAGIDFTLELNGIVDSDGCSGTGGGIITYSIEAEPAANAPGGPYQLCEGMPFDLTSFNNNINGSLTINWYEDINLTMPIANPSAFDPASSPIEVFATADNGTCMSQPVTLELIEIPTPVLDPIADVNECGQYEFLVPSGTNLGSNVYYEDAAGNQFFAGDVTMNSGTYTVFAGDDPNCTDMESFMVSVVMQPTILSPTNELTGCGEIVLPIINVQDADPNGFTLYSTGTNQSGDVFTENDVIMQSSGTTQLFVYAENGPGCFDEITINLNFTSDIEYVLPAYPAEACGDLELEPIGGATPGLAYYTEIDGGGDVYNPGDILPAPGDYTLYVYDPTIDQTCVLNSNESFTISLLVEPILDPIPNTEACATTGYVLPAITGTFLTGDEAYSTATNGGGDVLQAGDIITETTTIYIFNNVSSCPAQEVVFDVTIFDPPVAGEDNITSSCQGPQIDLNNYLSASADLNGTFQSDDATLTGANLDLWNSADGALNTPILFEYIVTSPSALCPPDTAEIIITLTNNVSAGVAIMDSTICAGETINLFGLLDGESGGGYFVDPNNPTVQIFDGEWTATLGAGDFQYIIEDMGGCSGAQSVLSVDVTSTQTFTAEISDDATCSGDCIELTINTSASYDLDIEILSWINGETYTFPINASGTQQYLVCTQEPAGEINGNVITLGEQMDAYDILFENNSVLSSCDADVDLVTNLVFTNQETSMDTIFGETCFGEPFMFNGQAFTTLGGTITDFSLNGCDSITVIQVEEFPAAENFEDDTYCTGTPVVIGGNIYTEDTNIQLMLPNASSNGCDSIIYVDIKFDDASYNIVDKTICLEESEVINGITYDVDTPIGEDTLFNGSVLGCDSIILVTLDFFDEAFEQVLETICKGDTIEILGEEFFEGMESMDIILSGASANGCDSTVSVSIDFFQTMETNENFEKCEGDTLDINGFLITDDNLDGFYTIEASGSGSGSDCASIVNYTTLNYSSSNTMIDTLICSGETIMINGIEFSQDYTYAEMNLVNANGCDSTIIINVNIESGDGAIVQSDLGNNMYELNFQSSTGLDPIWTSNSGSLSCDACASSNIVITENTEVTLSAMTANGCIISETLLLVYIPEEVFIDIFFPSIFTPDGIDNKEYVVYGTTGILIDEFFIYDRWGNVVHAASDFFTNDETAAWDGRIQGIDAAQGVYVGMIKYTDSQGVEQVETFDLSLVR